MSELLWAIQNGDLNEVENHLKQPGSEVNLKIGTAGRTAVHIAADYGHLPILRSLVKMGANIFATDDADISPLLYAIYGGHTKCAQFLVEEGADVNGTTPDGETFVEALDNLDISDEKKDIFRKMLKQ